MGVKYIFIIIGLLLLIVIVGAYIYTKALGKMWVVNTPDKSPYFITTTPIVVNGILLPKKTKITYKKRHSWVKYEQKKPLKNKDITQISLDAGVTIEWGGVPITKIIKFFNPEMIGYTVYADFNSLNKNKETKFSNLWKSCDNSLGIAIKNPDDWSFDKNNILDVESCSVVYQRYFKEDTKQQLFLDKLYRELMKLGIKN